MTTNGGSTVARNFPDVSMVAYNVNVYSEGGVTGVFVGTSCASPLWAAYWGIANQLAKAQQKGPLGSANSSLYHVALGSNYSTDFHDIADNSSNFYYWPTPGPFTAVSGFDLATGWGSPNGGQSLISDLIGNLSVWTATPTVSSTRTRTLTPTRTFTPTITLTPTVTRTFTFTQTYTPSYTPSWTITPTISPTMTITPTETITVTHTESPTITFTVLNTNTSTITDSPTISPTPKWSGTPTATSTITKSLTITLSPTITNSDTVTVTPTITLTYFPTLSPTPTPSQLVSGLDGTVLAPVPVQVGGTLYLFPDKPITGSQWDIFNLLGESVTSLSFSSPAGNSWNTQGVAPGVYAIRLKLSYSDGTETTIWKKIVVSR
jgi:hypothetical protein